MDIDLVALQRRTVRTLVIAQILGGLGIGATLSIGAVLAAQISGSDAWSGAAATLSTLGAATASIPLARLAARHGRRAALATGVLVSVLGGIVTVTSAAITSFPLLLLGLGLLGVATAVNLQGRFAATDVASPTHRGRDLSLVIWSTTIGAVAGPNLFGPGEVVARVLGMPELTGSFAIAVVAQVAAAAVYFFGLRPDPYLVGKSIAVAASDSAGVGGGIRDRRLLLFAIASIGLSHAVMVSVMSMTPVHLTHMGSPLTIVGFTISLHIAGMYALSPLFGWLSDRIGRISTLLAGQALFLVSVVVVALGELDPALVTVGLVLLGLGWSASTVAGSALIADLVTGDARTRVQGRADLVMNLSGAIGGASAGPVLALIGYAGLAWSAGVLVLLIVVGVMTVGMPRSRALRLELVSQH